MYMIIVWILVALVGAVFLFWGGKSFLDVGGNKTGGSSFVKECMKMIKEKKSKKHKKSKKSKK